MMRGPKSFCGRKKFLYALTPPKEYFIGRREPLCIAPLEHCFCGGVEIGDSGKTAVCGLYSPDSRAVSEICAVLQKKPDRRSASFAVRRQ